MRQYSKLPIPETSAWDKKSYDPIKWLYNSRENHPAWLEKHFFDNYFNTKSFVRDFFAFFKKLRKWLPVLWKDRNYDDHFIFEVLKKKIYYQREYLVANNRHTNIPDDNHWMTVCLNLIERIQDNYYGLEHLDY